MPYQRPQAATLAERLAEPRRHLQVVTGPRQVGKSTLVQQVVEASGLTIAEARADGEFWGRLVESAVGAHLANAAAVGEGAPQAHRDTAAFATAFKPSSSLLVGADGIELGEFLSQPVMHWVAG